MAVLVSDNHGILIGTFFVFINCALIFLIHPILSMFWRTHMF